MANACIIQSVCIAFFALGNCGNVSFYLVTKIMNHWASLSLRTPFNDIGYAGSRIMIIDVESGIGIFLSVAFSAH